MVARNGMAIAIVVVLASRLACGQGPVSYLTPPAFVSVTAPTGYSWAVEGDFDGDGLGDLVGGSPYSSLVFHPGTPQGTLGTELVSGAPGASAAKGDLDGDGDLDLILRRTQGAPQVMLNSGSGFFSPSGGIPFSFGAVFPATVDLDQDGVAEVLGFSSFSSGLPAAQGTVIEIAVMSGGAFVISAQIVPGVPLHFPVAGDVTGDGWPDLVCASKTNPVPSSSVDILYVIPGVGSVSALGSGYFVPFPPGALGTLPPFIGDFNEDGVDDFGSLGGASGATGLAIRIALSTPLGASWVTACPTWVPDTSQGRPFVGDVNDDGHLDIFGSNKTYVYPLWQYDLGVILGDGNGQFAASMVIGMPGITMPPVVAPTDVDGDGDLDLAVLSGQKKGVALSIANYGGSCTTSAGTTPRFLMGREQPGNAGFFLGVANALPGQPAVLGLSTAASLALPPVCGVAIDLSPGALLWPVPGAAPSLTDAAGAAIQPLPLPNLPALAGTTVYAQWAVADPFGPAGITFTRGRTIILW